MKLSSFLSFALPLSIVVCACHDKGKRSPAPQPQVAIAPTAASGLPAPSTKPASPVDPVTAKTPLCRPKGDESVRDCDSEVRGISESELHARYGKPDNKSEFMATNGAGEMRVEILNDYPPSDPASETTKIVEHTWNGDGFTFVLFLHKKDGRWEGLQALSYLDGVEF
ncbi:MAG: hypothetical protein JKY56_12575 [Kofleriaceae bacterium]|nr:hypothetical protein [Kofleriaceae bacterium]